MSDRTRVPAAMWCRRLALLQGLLLAACAPDYTPVRDWAGVASRAADYPGVALGRHVDADRTAPPIQAAVPTNPDQNAADEAPNAIGIVAMQAALATYLAALSTLAADGVLPYPEDPFVELATHARQASEPGGQAVAELGALLRRSTRGNARAPQMRATIAAADGTVQALVNALSETVARPEPMETRSRSDLAAYYARLEREARDPAARQSARDWAALYDREFAARAAMRTQYVLVLTRIAEGHALLKARSRHMTQEETARMIRAQADLLLRAAAPLPRAPAIPLLLRDQGSEGGRSAQTATGRILANKREALASEAGK